MYQSIPKRIYTTKESAMPKFVSAMCDPSEKQECKAMSKELTGKKEIRFLKKLETDDLLLIGLLLLLISEEEDCVLLIAVIAFLLFF